MKITSLHLILSAISALLLGFLLLGHGIEFLHESGSQVNRLGDDISRMDAGIVLQETA